MRILRYRDFRQK